MSAEKSKLAYEEDREVILQRSLNVPDHEEPTADEKARHDTDIVMDRHREELRRSILEMTCSA